MKMLQSGEITFPSFLDLIHMNSKAKSCVLSFNVSYEEAVRGYGAIINGEQFSDPRKTLAIVSAAAYSIALPEYRKRGIAESGPPVKRPSLGRSGAVCVHPVHSVLRDQRHKALAEFLHSLVEGFGRSMSVLPEHLVLCSEDTLDGPHQCTPFTCKIRIYLTLEVGLEKIA